MWCCVVGVFCTSAASVTLHSKRNVSSSHIFQACPLQAQATLSDGRIFTIGGSWNGGYSGESGTPVKNAEVRLLISVKSGVQVPLCPISKLNLFYILEIIFFFSISFTNTISKTAPGPTHVYAAIPVFAMTPDTAIVLKTWSSPRLRNRPFPLTYSALSPISSRCPQPGATHGPHSTPHLPVAAPSAAARLRLDVRPEQDCRLRLSRMWGQFYCEGLCNGHNC